MELLFAPMSGTAGQFEAIRWRRMLPLMVGADVPIRPLEPGTHPGKEERHGAAVRPHVRHSRTI